MMKKERRLQWGMGVGLGVLLLGIALFAQRAGDIFSFEHFRAPQFLLRDPSSEDRPLVEVVANADVDSVEKGNEGGFNSSSESSNLGSASLRSLRAPMEMITRPVIGIGDRLPDRLVSDDFRGADWQLPGWIPYYRDHNDLILRSDIDLPENSSDALRFSTEVTIHPYQEVKEGENEPNVHSAGKLEPRSFLAFSDTSVGTLGLRDGDLSPQLNSTLATAAPALSYRETPLGVRDGNGILGLAQEIGGAMWGETKLARPENAQASDDRDATISKFKDYTQKSDFQNTGDLKQDESSVASSEGGKSRNAFKREEDPGETLAKQNQKAKGLTDQKPDDRRFLAVEKKRDLYADDGGRMYAPGVRVGKFDVKTELFNRLAINDNLYLRPKGSEQAVATTTVTPSVLVAGGERDPEITDALYAAFRYSPTLTGFLTDNKRLIVDHDFAFTTGYRFSKLALVVNQNISKYSGGDAETASYITRTLYSTSLSAEYELSDKTSLELDYGLTLRDYQKLFDSDENLLHGYANYSPTEKIRLGLGGAYGVVSSEGGPDQNYEQALVRAVYFLSQKSTLYGETGLEQRHISGVSKDLNSIVYKAGGSVSPFPKTTITLESQTRKLPSSSLADQNLNVISFLTKIEQKFYKFNLFAGAGYDIVNYQVLGDKLVSQDRKATYYNIQCGLHYPIKEWWDAGFDFKHNIGQSNQDKFDDPKSPTFNSHAGDFESNDMSINSTIRF